MPKKTEEQSEAIIYWRVGDGVIHELPEGAKIVLQSPTGRQAICYFTKDGGIAIETDQ